MSRKLRSLFLGHSSAMLFSRISWKRVFQQPLSFTLIDLLKGKRKVHSCAKSRRTEVR